MDWQRHQELIKMKHFVLANPNPDIGVLVDKLKEPYGVTLTSTYPPICRKRAVFLAPAGSGYSLYWAKREFDYQMYQAISPGIHFDNIEGLYSEFGSVLDWLEALSRHTRMLQEKFESHTRELERIRQENLEQWRRSRWSGQSTGC